MTLRTQHRTLEEMPEKQDYEATLKLDWNTEHGGQIHLDGEMDFRKDQPIGEVYETLHQRAKQIGGLVSTTTTDGKVQVKVSCQYGDLVYILEAEDPSQPVHQITSINKRDDKEVTRTVDEMEKIGELAQKFKQALEDGDIEWSIEKDNERQNVMEM